MENKENKELEVFHTWLPCFPGFYGTLLEPDEGEEEDTRDYLYEYLWGMAHTFASAVSWQFPIDYAYAAFHEAASRKFCEVVEDELAGFDARITFEKLVSPREYNFTNDSVNVSIEIDFGKVMGYVNGHLKDFEKYLADHYTDCSGFWSSYSNKAADWMDRGKWENEEHQAGAILQFVLLNKARLEDCLGENTYVEELCYKVLEWVSLSEFVDVESMRRLRDFMEEEQDYLNEQWREVQRQLHGFTEIKLTREREQELARGIVQDAVNLYNLKRVAG